MTLQGPQEEDHLTHFAFLLLALSDPEVQVLVGEFSWGHCPSSHSALTPSLPRGYSCHASHVRHFEKLCRKVTENLQKSSNGEGFGVAEVQLKPERLYFLSSWSLAPSGDICAIKLSDFVF